MVTRVPRRASGTETAWEKRAKARLILIFSQNTDAKQGLSIILTLRVGGKRSCQKSYQGYWLVAASVIATLLFDPSPPPPCMSALPIIATQNSPKRWIVHPLIGNVKRV
ncbi:hypothetical protein JTE90_025701 [Oedothorax gibbosus]|uniref:Uncharacterized protein n=1 Tax=Oedothorax gibbosus TaxID=931172 RepID=A0AAV6TER1_9ARAC|nr:hypothetical protein JTE90_025701 [Oedothorax gibbosus]